MTGPSSSTAASTRPSLISVILSTYNEPLWLEKSLWGYACQSHRDFELVIADDGSDSATAETIRRIGKEMPMRIKHVWHDDDGFRKCTILNRAIESAAGDYLVFSDGDCIPRSDFVRQHYSAAETGRFLSGGYLKLPLSTSRQLSREDVTDGRAFRYRWLRQAGLRPTHRMLRLIAGDTTARILNRLTSTRPTWNGHNASGWTDDIRRAGGFDERMRYGGEDRELGERLENSGIRGKQVRYQAVCLHLDHDRGYVREADWQRNRMIRDATIRLGRTRTEHGIADVA
jgi:glycosyltransferase involved in cell wall biosynthesis